MSMFKVVAAIMLGTFTLLCPPLALLTVPIAIIWIDRVVRRRKEARRVLAIYEADRAERDRIKLFRSI